MTHYRKYSNAHGLLRLGIRRGDIIKLDYCELCGNNCKHQRIEAHHWNGYDAHLDVWWVCHQCNTRLKGDKFHNGEYSKAQIKKAIVAFNQDLCGADNYCKRCSELTEIELDVTASDFVPLL